ncbi:DUF3667 domain-containing protein [Pedobacter petrophilus]|uniref:DUF3667 domain-containing protein n=1 Tax=Pedobacter petrophilus TaxID=1908241 RepID=A0A7K0FYP6_9SPHI|nr:DUF3667 domain-containing protein [Pedobacter petrophilus]MRX75846.1 DUF3667 domain-containing protein [Pedobacter petrophilus]
MSAGKYRKEHNCLNCGSHVEKHYCSNCGQPNLELKESFWGFISHSIAHYFHFDNKFFQTLSPLLTKPGRVTLDYLDGKRARYINPVSMYIFVSIVYFLVAYSPKHSDTENGHKPGKSASVKYMVLDSVRKELTKAGVVNNKTGKILDNVKADFKKELDIEQFKALSFKDQGRILADFKIRNKSKKTDSLKNIISKFSSIYNDRNDSTYSAYLIRQKQLPIFQKDNWFERMVTKRSIAMGQKSEIITETLEHNRPKQYFLLMPLLALFIMWNFRKNHMYYLNHLIFTIHGMTAYFIVSIFTKPIIKYVFGADSFLSGVIEFGVFIWIIWYFYNALKVFYQRKRGAIIWKMIWIFMLYGFAFAITEVVMLNIIYYVS